MFLLLNEGGLTHITEQNPCTSNKVLTIHTVWDLNGNLQPIETLLDTGCNIAAIELDLVKNINTRSKHPIQIGLLSHTVKLQTASSNTIAACGKVQVSFRIGSVPMTHNFLVFPKLPYRIVLGTDFIYAKKLQLDFESGLVQTSVPPSTTFLCSHTENLKKEEMLLLKTKCKTMLYPFQTKWVDTSPTKNQIPH